MSIIGTRNAPNRYRCFDQYEWTRHSGEVFNAGHSERGNDIPAMPSTSKAERVEGGFRITGHKMFGILAPVFTRYGCLSLS